MVDGNAALFDCGKSPTRIDLAADSPREVRAAGDRQTTGDSGGGTQGRDRSPHGEHAGEETQPPHTDGRSSPIVSARIRGCGQINIVGESTGPQWHPPVHASVSTGSATFRSATFDGSDFDSQQLFGARFAFAAQQPDRPGTVGRLGQQQRPSVRDSGEQRQAAVGWASACGPKSPTGTPRLMTTYSVMAAMRWNRSLVASRQTRPIVLRTNWAVRWRSVGGWCLESMAGRHGGESGVRQRS